MGIGRDHGGAASGAYNGEHNFSLETVESFRHWLRAANAAEVPMEQVIDPATWDRAS